MSERPPLPLGSGGWADRLLAGEALLWLVIAAMALRAVPFPALARWVSGRPQGAGPCCKTSDQTALRIARAVTVATRRAPWVGACFTQALACHVMLRRRRLPARLFYGARNRGVLGPSAHVWVCSGDLPLVGAETAGAFALLATFPPLPVAKDEG